MDSNKDFVDTEVIKICAHWKFHNTLKSTKVLEWLSNYGYQIIYQSKIGLQALRKKTESL